MDWSKVFAKRPASSRAPVPVNPSPPATTTRPRAQIAFEQLTDLSTLFAAWRKVRANHGSAGVDGVSIAQFEKELRKNLEDLGRELKENRYRPQPVRRVYVPKPSGGTRPLAILAVQDRIAQRALYDLLAPHFEQRFLDCSFGFREGRSTRDAVARVVAARQHGLRWVVDGDIKNCFETLDHARLLRMLRAEIRDRRILKLVEQWLKANIFNELEGRDLAVGTFQGGILSPLLANIYLHTFDEKLTAVGLSLVRYADDWLILCAKKTAAQNALEMATHALEELRLAINPYKTRIVSFDEGFRFVGYFFVRDEVFNLSGSSEYGTPEGRGVWE